MNDNKIDEKKESLRERFIYDFDQITVLDVEDTCFVLSGFKEEEKEKIDKFISNLGGVVAKNIGLRTNYLVINESTCDMNIYKKALQLRNKGIPILIISSAQFYDMTNMELEFSVDEIKNVEGDSSAEREEDLCANNEVELRLETEKQTRKEIPTVTDMKLATAIERAFNKLEDYYPERKVFSLGSIDDTLREQLSALYKKTGYATVDEMFQAYGFETISGADVRKLRSCVKYSPGNEPDVIKRKVDNMLVLMEKYYPDHIVSHGVQKEHKSLSKTLSGLYQWLGYANAGEMLRAYGYEYNVEVGRVANDFQPIIDVLVEKYSEDPKPKSMSDLLVENPNLKGKIKTLQNKSNELFGMTLKRYFQQIGILQQQVDTTNKTIKNSKEKNKENGKKYLTISTGVVDILSDRIKRGLYPMYSLGDLTEKIDGLRVKGIAHSDKIKVTSSLRCEETVEIPVGIDGIGPKAFQGRKEIKRVVLSETVVEVERSAFEACDNLTEVVVTNPKCIFHPTAFAECNFLNIFIDRSELVKEILATIDDALEKEYLERINILEKCIQSAGGIPSMYWAGEDWKLAFSIGDVVYQTQITTIGEDYKELDEIIEQVFMGSRVTGTLDYFTDPINEKDIISKTIVYDADGNIV